MFKKFTFITLLAVLVGALLFGAATPAKAMGADTGILRGGPGRGAPNGLQPGGYAQGALHAQIAGGELSAEETEALLYMREEENLAHDVYAALYEQWGAPVFASISQSELTHNETIKALIDSYGLQDPASTEAGVFANPTLQALYNDLVAQGSQSLAEAFKVGAAIEELDILDLQERLAQSDNADIQRVFSNLLSGSENHLRAFVNSLHAQTGETYQPQRLSAEAYAAILASGAGRYGYAVGAATGAANGAGGFGAPGAGAGAPGAGNCTPGAGTCTPGTYGPSNGMGWSRGNRGGGVQP